MYLANAETFSAADHNAPAIERRIIAQVEGLLPFPERIRQSDRIPQARELVIKSLPYGSINASVEAGSEYRVEYRIVHPDGRAHRRTPAA